MLIAVNLLTPNVTIFFVAERHLTMCTR